MAPISWSTVKGLLIFFGPVLLPKAIAWYRRVRNAPRQHGLSVRPVPAEAARGLALLFGVAAAFFLASLPLFAPENVFKATQSRLQIPVDVLFNRLASLRPNGSLTTRDDALRARFVNLESRLLYLQFGPATLANCPFCNPDDPSLYYYYALPALLAPHLANLALVALVTSPVLTGTHGAPWRTVATIAAVTLCAADAYAVGAYDHQANSRALRLHELDFFYWKMRVYRVLGLAALDALLGWTVYLSSTNRAFVQVPGAAERADSIGRNLLATKIKMNAIGVIKNTVARDEELRSFGQNYWVREGKVMREVMEEREVIEGINDALQNGRLNIPAVTKDADGYAQSILQPFLAAQEQESTGST